MKSRFQLLAGLLLAIWISGAEALGVGEIELNSHLNQKLAAEIPLIDAAGLRSDEILVSLGTSEDFERAGVERFFYLTDMRFEVFVDGRGPRIRITTRQPVTEPYLNFIVEVLWPNGRMLKEFTLLLDPPTYESAVERAQTESSAVTSSIPATTQTTAPPSSSTSVSSSNEPAAYTRPASAAPPVPPGDGVTTSGRTLWGIADQYNPDASISIGQYMLAIQRRNPQAFINDNINRMKGGVRLQMPDATEAAQMSASEAAVEVARQTAVWRGAAEPAPAAETTEVAETFVSEPVQEAPELRTQMDASAPATVPVVEETSPPVEDGASGRLEIVGETGDSGAAESPAANADAGGLQEENARLQREIQELGYQSDREKEIAASEIEVKNRQLEVKDQQLAEFRQQLEELENQLAERQGQTSTDQNQPEKPWWQSTVVIAATGLIVVLALAGGLIVARRRKAAREIGVGGNPFTPTEPLIESVAEAQQPASGRVTTATGAAAAATGASADEDTFDFLEDERSGAETAQADDDAGDAGKSSPAMQTSDVISEADIYAAYGRYPHAIGLLLGALEENPDRHDVRLKLLEVAVSASDTETFERHIQELVDRCDEQDILLAARELEETFTGEAIDRTPDMGRAGPGSSDATPENDLLAGDDEFSLDLDDDPIASSADKSVNEEFLLELDDTHERDARFRAEPSEEEVSARAVLSTDEYQPIASHDEPDHERADLLGGDLGLDFDDAELIEEKPRRRETIADATKGGRSMPEIADDLQDDLDIDELLADLDDAEGTRSTSLAADSSQPDSLTNVQFSRTVADADVPLLDSADAVSEDDLLADADDGVEDLDDLLADLDEAEERSVAPDSHDTKHGDSSHTSQGSQKSAEILSFSRPRGGQIDGDESTPSSLFSADDSTDDDGFDFGTAEDAAETKLDLAQAYIEMGDNEGAQDILTEVLSEGNPAQRQLAKSLLDSLTS
jgi:pilus assembly protein FimV